MKRLTLILGAVALATISAPPPAHAQTGCSWWDLTCNGLANTVSDYAWHLSGRDAAGNPVYLRRRVDSNGNLVFEQAHLNSPNRYTVMNNHVVRKGTVYGPNGEICKYDYNKNGYKEDCKYAKPYKSHSVHPVHAVKTRHVDYDAPKAPKPVHYKAAKIEPVHKVDIDVKAAKGHEGKDEGKPGKGPKH